MSECSKCKHKQLSTVVHVESESGPVVAIKTRGGFYLDSSAGLMRVVPAGRYEFAFSVLHDILIAENWAVFYFVRDQDKADFIADYPEYASWSI